MTRARFWLFFLKKAARMLSSKYCSIILEVHYDLERSQGLTRAREAMQLILGAGVEPRTDLDPAFLQDVSLHNVNHKMSLADTFGVALARRPGCQFASTDHHELDAVHAAGVCDVLFVR